MKKMSRIPLLLLLVGFMTKTSGLSIQSVPEVNVDGVVEVEVKSSVSLLCGVEAGPEDEGAELVWLRNSAVVILMEGNRKGRSRVCVSPVLTEDDGADFTCFLKTNESVRASVTLNVTYAPDLSGSEEVTVEQQDELLLLCPVRSNPPVSSLLWTLNGSAVDLAAGGFTLTNDGFTSRLRAAGAQEGLHEGTYQCTADGQFSRTFYVDVTERTIKFPLFPLIAAVVVVVLTALLAVASRWKRIVKCCK